MTKNGAWLLPQTRPPASPRPARQRRGCRGTIQPI